MAKPNCFLYKTKVENEGRKKKEHAAEMAIPRDTMMLTPVAYLGSAHKAQQQQQMRRITIPTPIA